MITVILTHNIDVIVMVEAADSFSTSDQVSAHLECDVKLNETRAACTT